MLEHVPFNGFSVTMPLKEAVMPFLEGLSSDAEAIGAVNTIAFTNENILRLQYRCSWRFRCY